MKKYLILIASFFFLHSASHADTWSVRADRWCPYNCEPGANPGYMVEVLELAAKASGNTLEYRLSPWPRALTDARRGAITAVVGLGQAEGEGLVLSDKLGIDSACFFVNQGDPFKYAGIADLDKLQSIGVSAYSYTDEFMKWQKANPAKVIETPGGNALETNANLLKGQRIQAFLGNSVVVEHLKKLNPDLKGVVSAGCLSNEDLFIGVSAKNPKASEIAKAINGKVAELKKSGELAKIMGKYGVTGW